MNDNLNLSIDDDGNIVGATRDGEPIDSLQCKVESRGGDDSLQVRITINPVGVPGGPSLTGTFTLTAPDFDTNPEQDSSKSAVYAKVMIDAMEQIIPHVLSGGFKDATQNAVAELERSKAKADVIAEVIANLAMLKADGDKAAAKAFVLETLDGWHAAEGSNITAANKDRMAAEVYDKIDALP